MMVREEAYGLIDTLPEESVKALIQVMRKMALEKKKAEIPEDISPKKKEFQEL